MSSEVVPVYSPGRSRKKKVMHIMAAMAVSATPRAALYAICKMYMIMMIGTGFTRRGGVISFGIRFDLALDPEANAAVVVLPWVRRPQSGVRLDLMALYMGVSLPSRYCSPKTWIIGTGSYQA
jgi:hypothetical protein